jgi:MFS family permease
MRRPSTLHYAWIVAAVTFVVLLLTADIRAAPSVLIVPLEDEFHWSRSTISFAVGVNLLLYGLIGPFAAALIDRLGVRRTMTAALAVTTAGVTLTPVMYQPWQLILLWGVIVGAGCGIIGNFLAAFIAVRWFHVRQGLVVGLLTAANAAGQLIFLPTLATLVTQAGWRVMSVVLAAIVAVFIPFIALFDARPPRRSRIGTLRRYTRPTTRPGIRRQSVDARLPRVWRRRPFPRLLAVFVCGASTNGLIGTHLIPACVDHGLAEVTGAGLLAATGVFSFLGGTLSGWLSDSWDNRLLLAWYYGLRGLSLLYLPFAFDLSVYGLSLFSIFYGLDWIAGVPPTVRLLSRVVGTERTGIMVAWITVIHQMGGALAAYVGGVLRISFGSYFEAFLLAGLLCFAAALMALLIGAGGRRPEIVEEVFAAS